MKKYIIKSLFVTTLFFSLVSCNFLDIDPLDKYVESNIFADINLTDSYVTRHYTLARNGNGQNALRFVCDESQNNFNWESAYTLTRGQMTPDQYGGFSTWDSYYEHIKSCNIFFQNVDKIEASQEEIDGLVGEMTFFRAYYYLDLVSRFGGVPLITSTFDLNDENMMLPRDSYDDCMNFIVTEFDKAAGLLPGRNSGKRFGRVTSGAALAYKSRALLYAASPLWNTSNDKAKWQAAADAAKEVIDLGIYSLDADYKGLFLNNNSPEIIFHRLYTSEYSNSFDWQNSPNGWTGYSATCVLQGMVDSYEMADGTMPNPALYETATSNPWAGRDPRFYASIVCDGQVFRDREVEFWINEDGQTGGRDSKYGVDAWNTSDTRYTIRKFMDESLLTPWSTKGSQPWIFCRYGEILLNYAEAMYNLGNEDIAREYVNKIRKRARGEESTIVPDITAGGTDLLAKIQNERKIELAFEDHRFFDVRRWNIAEKTENIDATGIDIVKLASGEKKYKIVFVDTRKFIAPNHYLLPIPRNETNKNDLLEQNPGYTK